MKSNFIKVISQNKILFLIKLITEIINLLIKIKCVLNLKVLLTR